MAIAGTTVGPVEEEVRDKLAAYRDREGFPNYNEALRSLLEQSAGNRETEASAATPGGDA